MTEQQLHLAVCNYLRLQYPSVLFNSDMSGVKLNQGQAIKAAKLRSCKGWPDLFIAEPRNGKHGLFIELKKEGTKLTNKAGNYATEHIKSQNDLMFELRLNGYYCRFAIGFDQAKIIIDEYLTGR